MPDDAPVLYERRGPVAYVTMNRPRYRNAQNSAMTYALDDAFYRAAEDLQGLHTGMDSVFGLHHLARAHNAETAADSLGGVSTAALKEANT
ncbi:MULTISPECIES: hypothetical protein [unclassified Streptomyces]|uniref:hypothetical protein n=1 Tax=unclassified Streptomyces TaxID=2593676 RepID=UPI002E287299|nr:hypothetical protein [Streptomyces sp. NBC_00273]